MHPEERFDLSLARSPKGGYLDFRPTSATAEAEFGARTHVGYRRTINDDHHMIVRLERHHHVLTTSLPEGAVPRRFEEGAFGMVVADGMGGSGSETASRMAIVTLAHLVLHYGKWNVRISDDATAIEVMQRAERLYRSVK